MRVVGAIRSESDFDGPRRVNRSDVCVRGGRREGGLSGVCAFDLTLVGRRVCTVVDRPGVCAGATRGDTRVCSVSYIRVLQRVLFVFVRGLLEVSRTVYLAVYRRVDGARRAAC